MKSLLAKDELLVNNEFIFFKGKYCVAVEYYLKNSATKLNTIISLHIT